MLDIARITKQSIREVFAGISVALVLIPQAVAYAAVAGLPPSLGLFAAIWSSIMASFFVSSPFLQTGPVAMTSLLTLGALAPLVAIGSTEYIQLAIMLALLVGIIRLIVGLFRVGFISNLLSEPVLSGFMPAAGLLIISANYLHLWALPLIKERGRFS